MILIVPCVKGLERLLPETMVYLIHCFYMNDFMEKNVTLCNFYCQHTEFTIFTLLHLHARRAGIINK